MPEGRIVKALAGYYDVRYENQTVRCRARGLFKKKGISPLVGDWVTFDPSGNDEGYVTEIAPRSRQLIRPPVANIDLAVVVVSWKEPELNTLLLDKFLVHIEQAGLDALICLTKQDLATNKDQTIPKVYENMGYRVVSVGFPLEEQALPILERELCDRLSVLAGQSGAGKSTLLNELIPGVNLETGDISKKLGRGRHTTRHVELIALPGGGYVADTPGFSSLDFFNIETEELSDYFRDMAAFRGQCKFRGCLHDSEPGCAVKQGVKDGAISEKRYEHYKGLLQELKQKPRRY